ncbi:MAG: 30S ribosomal protein S1 [Actinomycetota bacterium]|nr:30S ribosomal protein S1 [Actinomycetota bacterium]
MTDKIVDREKVSPTNVVNLPDSIAPEDFPEVLEQTMVNFANGDIIEGTVVSVTRNEIMVDVGYKSEGVIPSRELSVQKDKDPRSILNIGDKVQALVINKEDDDGRLLLSVKRAKYEKAWKEIEKLTKEGSSVKGTVVEVVKGGLIVDIGVRGFLPASLIDVRRIKDLDSFNGKEIEAKIVEFDRQKNNIVLSRKAYMEEEMSDERQEFLDDLEVGNIKEGKVSSIVNFGAFVDIGGMDGLVHVSELSWRHVENPNEVVKVGDKVDVKVLEIDTDKSRISLSIKQVTDDPWENFSLNFKEGDIADGVVSKVVPFGAFVTLAGGVEGLVHVTEISLTEIKSPELELGIGQKVQIKLIEIDSDKRKVALSIKQADPEWKDEEDLEEKSVEMHSTQTEKDPQPQRQKVKGIDESLESILEELKERGIGSS